MLFALYTCCGSGPHTHMQCRWFGLGFVVYWCIGTPLLFRSYHFGKARAFWHYTTTQHNLWASYYLCLVSTQIIILSGHCIGMQCLQ